MLIALLTKPLFLKIGHMRHCSRHFTQEMARRTILVWDCGDGGGNYTVLVRQQMTHDIGYREAKGGISVSNNGLRIISYDALTMAAQFADETLPAKHETETFIHLESGDYRIRIIQMVTPDRTTETPTPDFIIEIEPGKEAGWPSVMWNKAPA